MQFKLKVAMAGLALMLAGGTAANAAGTDIVVHNNTNGAVWVTVYNLFKQQDWYGCAPAHGSWTDPFKSGEQLYTGGGVYVRYEYKQNADCTGKTNHDSHYGGLIGMPAKGTLDVYVPAR